MRLYIHRGFDDEEVPRDVTHVIVDDTVSVIKKGAFFGCEHLVSVIMGDSVKRIEECAFNRCIVLRFLRLSRTLEYIAECAFWYCESLEALFLPSTVNTIKPVAFFACESLRLLVLPHDIDLNNVDGEIIYNVGIHKIAENAGVAYEYVDNVGRTTPAESIDRVNEWLIPFHKLCYNSYVTTKQISDYLTEHGIDSALAIDPHRGMTSLHMLSMNPHAPADAILALLKASVNAANVEDKRGKTPLYYALHYNPCAFVRMYSYLREHANTIEIDIQSWGVQSWIGVDTDPGCTPLHVLTRNPFVPAHVIAVLLELKMEDAFRLDIKGLSPLDCARESNEDGLLSMITVLCNHRNSIGASKVEVEHTKVQHTKVEEHSKKRKEVLCNHRNSIGASKMEVEHTKVEHTKVEEHSKKRKEVKPWWSILIHNCRSLLCIHQCRRKSPLLVNKL